MKLKLYKPLNSRLIISQNFGENNCCIKEDGTGSIIPRFKPTCPIGYVSVYKYHGMKGHNGLDFPAKDWQPVYASLEGTVTEVSTEVARGLGVTVLSDQEYEWSDGFSNASGNNQIKISYWHFAGINVKHGQKVKVGELLGWADNTGYSTATHLHFQIKPVKDGLNVLQNNKMLGAIDPLPYLQDLSALEKQDILYKIKAQIADLFAQIQDLLIKK